MNDFYGGFGSLETEQIHQLATIPPGGSAPAAITLLAQSIVFEETKIQATERYFQLLSSSAYRTHLGNSRALLEALDLLPPAAVDLSRLPKFSFYLRIDFKLETPYISRDDRAFSINENPVRKDHVFEVPIVSSTTWKGALKNACMMENDSTRVTTLFGIAPEDTGLSEGGEGVEAAKGTLHLFPTFFGEIGLETINPHDRKTRTGKNPIRMECVPRGSTGTFALLYAPINPVAAADAAADIRLVTRACKGMLMEYGFAAKKSSGYGAASGKLGDDGGRLSISGNSDWDARFRTLDELVEKGKGLASLVEVKA